MRRRKSRGRRGRRRSFKGRSRRRRFRKNPSSKGPGRPQRIGYRM